MILQVTGCCSWRLNPVKVKLTDLYVPASVSSFSGSRCGLCKWKHEYFSWSEAERAGASERAGLKSSSSSVPPPVTVRLRSTGSEVLTLTLDWLNGTVPRTPACLSAAANGGSGSSSGCPVAPRWPLTKETTCHIYQAISFQTSFFRFQNLNFVMFSHLLQGWMWVYWDYNWSKGNM